MAEEEEEVATAVEEAEEAEEEAVAALTSILSILMGDLYDNLLKIKNYDEKQSTYSFLRLIYDWKIERIKEKC